MYSGTEVVASHPDRSLKQQPKAQRARRDCKNEKETSPRVFLFFFSDCFVEELTCVLFLHKHSIEVLVQKTVASDHFVFERRGSGLGTSDKPTTELKGSSSHASSHC